MNEKGSVMYFQLFILYFILMTLSISVILLVTNNKKVNSQYNFVIYKSEMKNYAYQLLNRCSNRNNPKVGLASLYNEIGKLLFYGESKAVEEEKQIYQLKITNCQIQHNGYYLKLYIQFEFNNSQYKIKEWKYSYE